MDNASARDALSNACACHCTGVHTVRNVHEYWCDSPMNDRDTCSTLSIRVLNPEYGAAFPFPIRENRLAFNERNIVNVVANQTCTCIVNTRDVRRKATKLRLALNAYHIACRTGTTVLNFDTFYSR